MAADPQALARAMVVDLEHPRAGATRALGLPIKLSASPGKVARPAIPTLARFARVRGRVAAALLAPETKVALLSEPFQEEVGPATPCDEQGRFALADVVPGAYRIVA